MYEFLKPISKQSIKRIYDQMNNSFNKIINNDTICIFTKIKYKNNFIPVMITNYQIINYISNNNNINIYNNKEANKIEFGKVKYFNKDFNIAVIQIKENNKINYLEIDDYLYKKDIEALYNKEPIYIIKYNDKNDITVTYSIIRSITNSEIIYSSYSNKNNNNNISIIFSLSNNKLIGIYNHEYKYYNKGLLFNFIINEFINEYKNIKIKKYESNEINILININKKVVNQQIYFLNQVDELNNRNTELYINNKSHEYKKFFIPETEGEYNIKLKFNKNLTDCSHMFSNCENIIGINFISFNTKYVISMEKMFHKCKNLKYINNLLLFDTKNVIDMSDMFSFCKNLNNLDLTSFNINNVKNMSYMFYYYQNLKNLKLFYMNTQNSVDMDYMFDMCDQLTNIPFYIKNNRSINKYPNEINILIKVKKEDIQKKVYFLDNYKENFNKGDNLKELNNDNTELYIDGNKNEFKKYFIPKDEGDYHIKLKFNINLTDCSYMFAYCENITQINFIFFNTSYIKNMQAMFSCCKNLIDLNLSSFDTKNVTNMSYMFDNCNNLNYLDLSSFNTENVENMSYMFSDCKNLNNIDLSSFNTKNVINISYMFSGCKNLNNINLSFFDTKNVINMSSMFNGCENLNNLDLSSFDTKKVFDMSFLFWGCNSLNNLNISSFDTKNVTNMSYMFSCCVNLEYLDLSSFNTKNVTNMSHMFDGCKKLKHLDLSSFDTDDVINVNSMFYDCPDNIYEFNKSKFKKFKKEKLTDYIY